jgi:hypothetical protein
MNEPRLRAILLALAVYHLLLGAFMFLAPGAFYDTLGKFAPKNTHYVKDVATFYLAMGVVFFISVRRRSWRTPILLLTTIEYGLHALNHLVDVDKASTSLVGWFDFFALSAIFLFLAALTSVAWRISPESATASSEPPEKLSE